MNELANFCESVGANVDLVRESGQIHELEEIFIPGIGYERPCFPKDVNALIKTSEEHNSPIRLLKVVDEVNKLQKLILVKKL